MLMDMSLEAKVKEWVELTLQTQLELPCKLKLPKHVKRKLGLRR
jgi:hypothetical protein